MTKPTGLEAALRQGARNAERIAGLDAAVADLARKLADLGTVVDAVHDTVTGQAEALASVEALKDTVHELAHRLDALFPGEDAGGAFYRPIPAPRFWQLDGTDRDLAVGRLRSWVADVYRPVFGHLAQKLPTCWEQHTFCLTVLDVASELHAVLYLQATRNQGLLAGQAELLTRLMPALAALMAAEVARCPHTPTSGYAANGTTHHGGHGGALPALTPGPQRRG